MLGVVVVRLHLGARIGQVLDARLQAVSRARGPHAIGQLADAELLGELVEDAEFAALRRVEGGQLDASDRIADVEKAPRLPTLAIDSERVADRGLGADTVDDGAPDVAVVDAGPHRRVPFW